MPSHPKAPDSQGMITVQCPYHCPMPPGSCWWAGCQTLTAGGWPVGLRRAAHLKGLQYKSMNCPGSACYHLPPSTDVEHTKQRHRKHQIRSAMGPHSSELLVLVTGGRWREAGIPLEGLRLSHPHAAGTPELHPTPSQH